MLRALSRENSKAFCDGEGFHNGGDSLVPSPSSPAAVDAAALLSSPSFAAAVLLPFSLSLSRPLPLPLPLGALPEDDGAGDGFLPFPFACSS